MNKKNKRNKKDKNNKKDKRNKKGSSSILFVKNSKSKSNKYIKKGQKGRDCIYFNSLNLSCNNKNSGKYKQLCSFCDYFKNRNDLLSDYDENYIQEPLKAGTHESNNEYISLSKNIGTPVHIGYIKSDGHRRHKARCIYYNKITKSCTWFINKCVGSSKCEKYKEKQN